MSTRWQCVANRQRIVIGKMPPVRGNCQATRQFKVRVEQVEDRVDADLQGVDLFLDRPKPALDVPQAALDPGQPLGVVLLRVVQGLQGPPVGLQGRCQVALVLVHLGRYRISAMATLRFSGVKRDCGGGGAEHAFVLLDFPFSLPSGGA